jgi:hypothetical protein
MASLMDSQINCLDRLMVMDNFVVLVTLLSIQSFIILLDQLISNQELYVLTLAQLKSPVLSIVMEPPLLAKLIAKMNLQLQDKDILDMELTHF